MAEQKLAATTTWCLNYLFEHYISLIDLQYFLLLLSR